MPANCRYDMHKLRSDLRKAAGELRTLKKTIHQSGYQPTWREYGQLRALKKLATELCCLRAHHRGKMHLCNHEICIKLVREREAQYLLNKEAQAA